MSRKAEIEAFVAAARDALPAAQIDSFEVRTFGNSPALAETLIQLIASGEKTGTFALECEASADPSGPPRVGQYVIVTTFDGIPTLLYKVTHVEIVAFGDISVRHIAVEGARLRELAAWREVHRAYWTPILQKRGESLTAATRVYFQRFTALFSQ